MELAAPVSARVELMTISLVESLARRQPFRDELPDTVTLSASVQSSTDEDKQVVNVQPSFLLTGAYADKLDEEVLRIEARFHLLYRIPSFDGLASESITAFGETNGVFNAWPYWREFVQSTTVRMGLPPLTVPVYRVLPQAPKKRNSRKETRARPAAAKRLRASAKTR